VILKLHERGSPETEAELGEKLQQKSMFPLNQLGLARMGDGDPRIRGCGWGAGAGARCR